MRRPRVYVAGPITLGDLQTNVERACGAGMVLLKAGLAPLVPHLSCYWSCTGTPETLPCGTQAEEWYQMDLAWVEVSDALLRLPGESRGADGEVEFARDRGIPVFHCTGDVITHFARNSDLPRLCRIVDQGELPPVPYDTE